MLQSILGLPFAFAKRRSELEGESNRRVRAGTTGGGLMPKRARAAPARATSAPKMADELPEAKTRRGLKKGGFSTATPTTSDTLTDFTCAGLEAHSGGVEAHNRSVCSEGSNPSLSPSALRQASPHPAQTDAEICCHSPSLQNRLLAKFFSPNKPTSTPHMD